MKAQWLAWLADFCSRLLDNGKLDDAIQAKAREDTEDYDTDFHSRLLNETNEASDSPKTE